MSTPSEVKLGAQIPGSLPQGRYRRLAVWAHRVNLERKLAVALLVATVGAGTVTFAAMTGNLPVVLDTRSILLLLNLDLILLLGLGALIARRLVILWVEHRRGLAGAHLHVRLVGLFSLVAVTPTIVVATFSVLLFDFGLQGWFSDRVRTAVKESFVVAQAYLEEHRRSISSDALAMAQDLNRRGVSLVLNPYRFNQALAAQVRVRSLTEAIVFDGAGRVLGRAGYSLLLDFDPQIPDWALKQAQDGEVVIMTADTEDRVRALLRLDRFTNAYLYVGRLIDPRVLSHIDTTNNAARLYEELEGKRSDLQITFALVFVVVALMLLLAAVWVGLAFANNLTRPIGKLIAAAERIGSGDLSARVEVGDSPDEIGTLSQAFNRMTGELQSQQEKLLEANRELDYRNRFIEAVLGGVSAGVIGLDKAGEITLPNRSACALLSMEPDQLRGRKLAEAVPEMAELLVEARRRPRRRSERTIVLSGVDGTARHLLVRIAAELDRKKIVGFVVTFDDITELLSAQRKAAWADVARRIAHEIKNPLTPIQLAAERLQRKYLGQIETDPETFRTCTDIIVRHVGDIGRMVDEFTAFARMPAPVMADEDLTRLIEEAMFLQRGAHADVGFGFEHPDHPVVAACDGEQIGRALTNLLQNAVDAIQARRPAGSEAPPPGRITVRMIDTEALRAIEVEDNGRGLPKVNRHRLTEPYVTARDQGTGLGLAIVKKIMEDHGGDLTLEDSPSGGARIRLIFPLPDEQAESAAPAQADVKPKAEVHGA
ncbi:MAG: PAS domain-containing sensor histidine kinase [Proteobacteria bacterium]|nr:PAS domain-containing sensor histidine kinase [Pseudomonadota bacterium]